jgi:hypothetical protein
MKYKKLSIVLFMFLLFAACQEITGNRPGQTVFPSLAGLTDEGVFEIYNNEEQIAINTFQWRADGSYESGSTMTMADQSVYYSVEIEVDKTGQWTNVHRRDPIKIRTFINKKEEAAVLGVSGDPALLRMVIRAYDQAKAGRQTIRIFYVPGKEVIETGITRQDPIECLVKGTMLKLTPYFFENRDGELTIYTDTSDRVIFIESPHQYMIGVRQGYEELLQIKKMEPGVSAAQYEVVKEKNVMVPMRDGISLATDIYKPKAEGPWPVIFARTPYGKEMAELYAHFYARRGYVFAVQDCRGRFSSPGVWKFYVNEAHDGYDAIEWLASRSWSSGKVGMIGGSYVGWVQWSAARERPPHLTTIIPNCSPSDPNFDGLYEYGCFWLTGTLNWADMLEKKATADISGQLMQKIGETNWSSLARMLPVIELDKRVLGQEIGYWRTTINHPDLDAYLASAGFLEHLEKVNIPVFQQSGWFDHIGNGTKLNYLKMKSLNHPNQKLVMGPWGHTDTASRSFEGHDFGKKAWIDLQRDYLRWFDFWLKGMNNGIDKEPLVSIFVMGANEWIQGNTYPLPQTQMTKLYLVGSDQVNTSKSEGLLSFEQPSAENSTDRFVYDPSNPTPPSPRYREKADDQRSDMLVYQTEPLKKPLTFAGPLSAMLYASTSAKDTDWFMRLCVVAPQGAITVLTEGKIRARYRNSFEKPELLKPGEICAYNLDLWHTAIQIPANGRLRVEVASASFPHFSRNLNTGGHNETETEYVKAEQTIYHDAAHPSYILLPIVKLENEKE